MKKIVIAAACLLAASAVSATPFRAVASTNALSTNGSWSFGTVFTVGANAMTLTSLGAFDAGRNGFTSGGIDVGMYDETSQALLTSARVSSSDSLLGDYRYATINALTLLSGHQYRLVAVSGSDLYSYPTSTYSSDFTVNRFAYCASQSLASCNDHSDGDYGMANFQYSAAARVPEPASLALLGLGLAGVMVARRRKA